MKEVRKVTQNNGLIESGLEEYIEIYQETTYGNKCSKCKHKLCMDCVYSFGRVDIYDITCKELGLNNIDEALCSKRQRNK